MAPLLVTAFNRAESFDAATERFQLVCTMRTWMLQPMLRTQ